MKAFIGVDVSKNMLDIAIVLEGKITYRDRFRNDKDGIGKLIDFVSSRCNGVERVFACEATGVYHKELVRKVYDAGEKVMVINPRLTKHETEAMGIKSCTDKKDAEIIAFRASREQDRLWTPPDENGEILRELILRRDQIITALGAERNRRERFAKGSYSRKSVERLIKVLEKEFGEVNNEIDAVTKRNEELKNKVELAQTVPGVGKLIATSFIAKVSDISVFKTAEQLLSFLGLCPQQKLSGTSVRKSWMSCRGDALFRKQLYMGAIAAARAKTVYREYYLKLVASGRCKKSALAAVMRKIVRALFAVLRDSVPFSKQRYGVNPFSPDLI